MSEILTNALTRSGRIVAIRAGLATIRVETPSACGGCGGRGACGTASGTTVLLPVPASARPGDAVMLALAEGLLVRGALRVYLLPASAMLLGAALLSAWGDLAAVGGALSGLGSGLIAMRMLTRRRASCDAPAVLPAPTFGVVPPTPTIGAVPPKPTFD
ncbi:MAG: SoxR reducing system RseC family protein [Rhodocyclaceae bacterium]|nr:SoxR reducing system RseC family protein [Rhodocyclaceae bacterium]